MKEAALFIANYEEVTEVSPQETNITNKDTVGMEPLNYLIYVHDKVECLGIDHKRAKELRIGYVPKGIMRGRVVFPIYDNGILTGYIGYSPTMDPPLKLPPNL